MTAMYQHILVAVDLSQQSTAVIIKAKKIAALMKSELTFLHVVEPSLEAEHIYVDMDEYKKIATQEAKKKFHQLLKDNDLPNAKLILDFGNSKTMIAETANRLQCDLIMVGSHGRHGLQLILGSTSSAILHKADCDVFVVRYTNK